MNEATQIWLYGGAYGFIFAMSVAGVTFGMAIVQRISRLEAVMALFGEKAAKILHSPHTPELDALLEKFCDRHYTMSHDEWEKLLSMTLEMEVDTSLPKQERALAAWVNAAASEKLCLPPPKPHKHT